MTVGTSKGYALFNIAHLDITLDAAIQCTFSPSAGALA